MHLRNLKGAHVLILLVAFALRIWGLAQHSIWWDEGIGIWLARMPVLESIRWTAGDVHPPLYYIVLRGWRLLAGEGEFVQRFPSALFSFLTVALIYRLGKQLGGPRTGWLSALFLALSRFAIWWAQEIRMYALAAMLATAALWSAALMWQESKGRRADQAWALYVGATLATLYTLYLSVTVAVVTNLGFLIAWSQRARRKQPYRFLLSRWLTAQIAVALLFVPWLAYALPKMHGWSSDTPFAPGFFLKLYATMLTIGSPLDLDAQLPLTLSVFLGLAVALILLWRQTTTSPQVGGLMLLLSGLLLPPLAVVAVSLPGLGFYISRPLAPRYLLPLSSCYYTLLAWAVTSAHRREGPRSVLRGSLALGITGLALITALIGLSSFYPGRARRDDFVTIATVLEAHRRPEDVVVLYVDRDWPIFTTHYAGDRADLPYGANLSDPATAASWLAPIWEESEAVWLVTTPESLQADPQKTVLQWLDSRAVASARIVDGANSLTFYARTDARARLQQNLAPQVEIPNRTHTSFGLVGYDVPLPRYRTGDTVHISLCWSASPPDGTLVRIQGRQQRLDIDVPAVPTSGETVRSQIDLALTPKLPRGTYGLLIQPPGMPPFRVGDFTLIHRAVGAEVTPEQIPYPLDYRLGEAIHLIGYALPQKTVRAGNTVPLTLYWRAEQPISERYKVFTHLLGDTFNANAGNFLWGQQDNEPVSGQAQTTLWTPGAVIVDRYQIPVAPNAPPGLYSIEVGMYGLTDGIRLAVTGPEGPVPDNAISLAQVEVR
ncbi:MAG: glycosyltransferase family 39 protein [Anaerolineae bacterium]